VDDVINVSGHRMGTAEVKALWWRTRWPRRRWWACRMRSRDRASTPMSR
jgi:hypothetical protein